MFFPQVVFISLFTRVLKAISASKLIGQIAAYEITAFGNGSADAEAMEAASKTSASKTLLFSRVHATLQVTMSVCRSVGRLVGWSVPLYFFCIFELFEGR